MARSSSVRNRGSGAAHGQAPDESDGRGERSPAPARAASPEAAASRPADDAGPADAFRAAFEPDALPPFLVAILRVYARALLYGGIVVLAAAVWAWAPPGPRGHLAAALAALAVAALRWGAVPLSKFSYVTMTVVPVGVLTLLGEPTAAILAAAAGTLLGDVARGKEAFPSGVNAGREVLARPGGAGARRG